MKFFTSILLIWFFTCALAKHNTEELVAHGEKCNGTIEDMKKLANYEVADTETGKCMLTCMCKDIGIMDKSGKYNKLNLKKFFQYRWTELGEAGNAIADNCDMKLKDYKIENECHFGHEIVRCFAEQMRQKGAFASLKEKSKQVHDKLNSGTYKTSDEVKQILKQDIEKYQKYTA